MPIIYSLISRHTTILVEYSTASGNFVTVSRVILEKMPQEDTKKSYEYDDFIFHFQIHSGVTYMCMADKSFPRRICFLFLEDIKNRFLAMYGEEQIRRAMAYTMNEDFSRSLSSLTNYYSNDPSVDRILQAKQQIEDTRQVMVENIELLLTRGEKIDLLVEKTDTLNVQAIKYKQKSKDLKCAMWYKNLKLWIITIIVILILIWLIVSGICGFDFSKCTGD
eukprot:TRINITY_DN16_c0_g5_i1.p1 TRINITY_DN16_c0_g5~~TRINITY_DN16_c0_g5_i1.p1  ORF type:complete len:257 (+),score=87.41 TRINITY_DN16_c0_g5_i1:109-771(+)